MYDPKEDRQDEAIIPADDIHTDGLTKAQTPPSVVGEEDVFSGDAAGAEPANIDDELELVGLKGDDDSGPRELGVQEELE